VSLELGLERVLLSSGILAVDSEIPARGVELIIVQPPSPLNNIGTGLNIRRNSPAATAWSEVAINVTIAVLVLQLGDVGLILIEEVLLGRVSLGWLLLHVDEDRLETTFTSVVLGRPADAHLLTRNGFCLSAPFALICRVLGRWECLIRAITDTAFTIGASRITLFEWTLVVVAVRRRVIQLTELELGVDRESAGPTVASSCTCGIA
jgi:hypothetical protein